MSHTAHSHTTQSHSTQSHSTQSHYTVTHTVTLYTVTHYTVTHVWDDICRGVATLSDYRDKPVPSEDKDAEQYYAGGSEHSGQMIEGPPRKKQNPEGIAQSFIDAAKK